MSKPPAKRVEPTEEQKAAKELERKRRERRDLTERTVRPEAAVEEAKRILTAAAVRGTRSEVRDDFGGASLQVERGWALGASLDVRVSQSMRPLVVNPGDDRQYANLCEVKVTLSWSATSRTVATALAAVALYRELTELAAEVESVLAERTIVAVHGQ